ncbi:MAG: cobyrinate a,c-diamide synthase [Paludibacterium sp.]|uniref:cobyrinate a,c-diamide synthase n=1 Tax=Paludibacterium sp. TaxID=1917523 RepID=UPI0025E4DE15|nr:cobyrinate a,c-diamide synthase [Paludibacterium sp.]MBV8046998.1 cobyrinate a,c-diamide synthase [Paludibacterium sp.]MBV8649070.1 cobyrinate a,c-diamide synthase [Paludibacterium sp.]
MTRFCPALMMTAPASHQGKTTLTAGLARFHRGQGRRVRVFKVGPDFLDPYILERASGAPVESLDLWMTGEDDCRARLYQAAGEADLILVEGSMGLFDGTPSSADLAERFDLPLVAVIDAAGMAQTFGAVALGLASLRPQLRFHGMLANQVAGQRHADMLCEGLPPFIPYSGYIARQDDIGLPERHLGLVQAQEIDDLEARLDRAARQMATTGLAKLPPAIPFPPAALPAMPPLLAGRHIAVARDAAFSFLYPANLQCLRDLGATLTFFSPLADEAPQACDALYLPGGYPELHLQALAANRVCAAALAAHVAAGKPLYAECGGMLYLFEHLTDQHGQRAAMLGLLPGEATLGRRLAALGLQQIELDGQRLRGHTFHYSTLATSLTVAARATRAVGGTAGEAFYRQGNVRASYLHAWFPSNPLATSRLFLD